MENKKTDIQDWIKLEFCSVLDDVCALKDHFTLFYIAHIA